MPVAFRCCQCGWGQGPWQTSPCLLAFVVRIRRCCMTETPAGHAEDLAWPRLHALPPTPFFRPPISTHSCPLQELALLQQIADLQGQCSALQSPTSSGPAAAQLQQAFFRTQALEQQLQQSQALLEQERQQYSLRVCRGMCRVRVRVEGGGLRGTAGGAVGVGGHGPVDEEGGLAWMDLDMGWPCTTRGRAVRQGAHSTVAERWPPRKHGLWAADKSAHSGGVAGAGPWL